MAGAVAAAATLFCRFGFAQTGPKVGPASTGTQQGVLNAGTLIPSWGQKRGELRDTHFSFPFNFQAHSATLVKLITIMI